MAFHGAKVRRRSRFLQRRLGVACRARLRTSDGDGAHLPARRVDADVGDRSRRAAARIDIRRSSIARGSPSSSSGRLRDGLVRCSCVSTVASQVDDRAASPRAARGSRDRARRRRRSRRRRRRAAESVRDHVALALAKARLAFLLEDVAECRRRCAARSRRRCRGTAARAAPRAACRRRSCPSPWGRSGRRSCAGSPRATV